MHVSLRRRTLEVDAGVAAGAGAPPEVAGDGFSFTLLDIETMVGNIGSVQRHRRLCWKHRHRLREEMQKIPRVAP